MAIAKLLLLLPTAIAQQYGLVPPSAHPPAEELREQRGFERRLPYVVMFVRAASWGWAVFEGLVLFVLSGHCPHALSRPFMHVLLGPFSPDDSAAATTTVFTALKTPSYAFVFGTVSIFSGLLLRAHTFRVLGPRFTIELSIRGPARAHPSAPHSTHDPTPTEPHTLVTHGIYSIVRHPSYTGAYLIYVGWCLCLLDRQGSTVILTSASLTWCRWWWRGHEYGSAPWLGIHDTTATTAVLVCLWVMALALMYTATGARMEREDAMLEEHFGEEWRIWVKNVPWRLIPGAY